MDEKPKYVELGEWIDSAETVEEYDARLLEASKQLPNDDDFYRLKVYLVTGHLRSEGERGQ